MNSIYLRIANRVSLLVTFFLGLRFYLNRNTFRPPFELPIQISENYLFFIWMSVFCIAVYSVCRILFSMGLRMESDFFFDNPAYGLLFVFSLFNIAMWLATEFWSNVYSSMLCCMPEAFICLFIFYFYHGIVNKEIYYEEKTALIVGSCAVIMGLFFGITVSLLVGLLVMLAIYLSNITSYLLVKALISKPVVGSVKFLTTLFSSLLVCILKAIVASVYWVLTVGPKPKNGKKKEII